jgi:hypothetical protein
MVLKGASNEEVADDVVAVVAMLRLVDDEARNLLILNVWSVETPRYPTWLQESGRATRGTSTLRRSQVKSAQAPRGTW